MNAKRRIDTPEIDLMYVPGSIGLFGATGAVVPFRFQAPGPRVRLSIKFTVRQFVDQGSIAPPSPVPWNWTASGRATWSLWLCRSVISTTGARVPVQNILGTRANPVNVSPFDGAFQDSVNGFSLDVEAGGDGIDGEMTWVVLPYETDVAIMATIRGRYNAVQPLCDEEWAYLSQRMRAPEANRVNIS